MPLVHVQNYGWKIGHLCGMIAEKTDRGSPQSEIPWCPGPPFQFDIDTLSILLLCYVETFTYIVWSFTIFVPEI